MEKKCVHCIGSRLGCGVRHGLSGRGEGRAQDSHLPPIAGEGTALQVFLFLSLPLFLSAAGALFLERGCSLSLREASLVGRGVLNRPLWFVFNIDALARAAMV